MPRRSRALISTDRQVAGAKPPASGKICSEYRIAGSPNLVLRVTASGYRSWTYWLKRPRTGRWQKFNVGPYPAVGLARARDEAVRLRRSVLDGVDPFDTRSAGCGVPTLRTL
ncbi:MAG: Arm DNA-binding domain-containing protein, partial [Hyphomicrobiaceae bacterium]